MTNRLSKDQVAAGHAAESREGFERSGGSLLDGIGVVLWSSALAALVGIGLPFYLVVSLAERGNWGMGAIGLALITMTLGVIVGVPGAIALALRLTGHRYVTATVVFVVPLLALFGALNIVFDRLVWSPHPAIIVPMEAMAAGAVSRGLAIAWGHRGRRSCTPGRPSRTS